MKYYEIGFAQKDLIGHLAPEEMIKRLKQEGSGAILAVEEDDSPVGIVIFDLSHPKLLDIYWLNVFEDYRGRGIGGDLLIAMYDKALNEDRQGVRVMMTGELAYIENVRAVEDYFYAWGFTHGRYLDETETEGNRVEIIYVFLAPADFYEKEKARIDREASFDPDQADIDDPSLWEGAYMDPIYIGAPKEYTFIDAQRYDEELW